MKNIKKISDVVKHILISVPDTRSNNKLLYCLVCEEMNPNALALPFGIVFSELEKYSLPNPETVTRCRRRLQEKYPELSANDKVARYRAEQEQKYKDYAKAVNV